MNLQDKRRLRELERIDRMMRARPFPLIKVLTLSLIFVAFVILIELMALSARARYERIMAPHTRVGQWFLYEDRFEKLGGPIEEYPEELWREADTDAADW